MYFLGIPMYLVVVWRMLGMVCWMRWALILGEWCLLKLCFSRKPCFNVSALILFHVSGKTSLSKGNPMMLAQSSIQSIMKGSVTTAQKILTYSLKLSATTGEIF